MARPTSHPLPRERTLILAVLLVLAALAWVLLIWQSQTMDNGRAMDDSMAADLTMGMAAPLFIAMWVAMMVAMMFPTAAPMILTFAQIAAGKERRGQPFVPTWVFVAGYLVIWTGFGLLAYLAALGANQLAERSIWLQQHGAQLGGVVLILAGLYQLSPLKNVCLTACRSPMAFILRSWRDGRAGALRMGVEHGLYCLGCCWLLFVLLFPLGITNIGAMVVLTLLIFAEKSWPLGHRIAQVAAGAFVGYGIVVVLMPEALPTML